MGRRVMNMMTERANQREQFGKPIGEFQMIQQMLADSLIELNCAHLLVLDAALEIDRGLDPREKVSMVKINSVETLNKIADRAVQIYGAKGTVKTSPWSEFIATAECSEFMMVLRKFTEWLSPEVCCKKEWTQFSVIISPTETSS